MTSPFSRSTDSSQMTQVPDMRAETWCVDGYPENLNIGFWNMLSRSELELGVTELEQREFDDDS